MKIETFMSDWVQFTSIIIFVLGTYASLWREIKKLESRMDKQSDRTDRLYEMFIDLLKDGRK